MVVNQSCLSKKLDVSLELFAGIACAAGVEQVRMRELAAAAYAAGEVEYARGAEAAIEMLTKTRLQVLNTDQDQVEYFMPSPSLPVQVFFNKSQHVF